VSPKFSSAAAVLNFGIFLSFLTIDLPFASAHITSRDDSNFGDAPCENDKEHPMIVGLPEQIVPFFIARMRLIEILLLFVNVFAVSDTVDHNSVFFV